MVPPVLVDDVIILILDHVDQKTLYSCLFVNSKLYQLTLPTLWRSPRFMKFRNVLIFQQCLQPRPHMEKYIKELCFNRLGFCNYLDDELLIQITKSCKYITKLDLSFAGMITDAALTIISKHCSQLNNICLRECRTLTNDSIKAIAKGCLTLISLNFERCLSITSLAFDELTANHKNYVKKLDLTLCKWVNDDMAPIISKFYSLRKLNLTNCTEITSDFLTTLAPNVPNLEAIYLGGVLRITDEGVIQVVDHCPNLRILVLCGCDIHDRTLYHIAKKLKNLYKLDVSFCMNITHNAMRTLLCMNITKLSYGESDIDERTLMSLRREYLLSFNVANY
ncbi:hypothetical protein Glove_261g66 [Diversispora epigaea]|uniref:F-box/LRR-repeat protein 15-like leucin rich repeat domain-containing protein n=1 Tax=Diversispora epigaea TaxID=1348612 RepID=A0A397IDI8_9GLOM|nr:hypothetical protein Glove_261g66 [Diversispora epigaea]